MCLRVCVPSFFCSCRKRIGSIIAIASLSVEFLQLISFPLSAAQTVPVPQQQDDNSNSGSGGGSDLSSAAASSQSSNFSFPEWAPRFFQVVYFGVLSNKTVVTQLVSVGAVVVLILGKVHVVRMLCVYGVFDTYACTGKSAY